MGQKFKKLKKSLKKRYKYIDPIGNAIINYPQERTKYEADAAANLLTGTGDNRREYIKEVVMDGINERVALLGSYITDRYLYEGPHVDQMAYYNQSKNTNYTNLVGKLEASLPSRVPKTAGFTSLDLVKILTGNPKINEVYLEDYGHYVFDWKVRKLMAENHPWHYDTGNWEVDLIDEVLVDEYGNELEDVPPGSTMDVILVLVSDENFSSWTNAQQKAHLDLYRYSTDPADEGKVVEEFYTLSRTTTPNRYMAAYSEPMLPIISTRAYGTPVLDQPYSATFLTPPTDYGLEVDNTVDTIVDLYKKVNIYEEKIDNDSNTYWDLIEETTELYSSVPDVKEGTIVFLLSDVSDAMHLKFYRKTNSFKWHVDVVETEEEYTESSTNYRKEVFTDTLVQLVDTEGTIERHILPYMRKHGILNVPKASAEAYYNVTNTAVNLFPIIPIRYESKWIDEDISTNGKKINRYVDRYIKLLLGIKKDKFLDSLKDSYGADAHQVHNAVINFAVPINTTDPRAQWYLFEFFKKYSIDSTVFKDALEQYHLDLEELVALFNRSYMTKGPTGNYEFFDPVTYTYYKHPGMVPFPTPPTLPAPHVLPTINTISKYNLDRTIKWISTYREVNGVYNYPGIKTNDVIVLTKAGSLTQRPIIVPDRSSTFKIEMSDPEDKTLIIVKQGVNTHEIVEVPELEVESREAFGITMNQEIVRAFEQDEGNVILAIPLVREIMMSLPAPMRAQTALAGMMLSYGIAFTYKVKTGLGKVLDSVSKLHKTAVNTYRISGGAGDLLRSFERMHRIPTQEILYTLGHGMARSDRDFENGFMKVFGGSRGTAKTWHGVIKIVIMIIIMIFTAGIGGAVVAGANAAAAIGAAFASITAQQIAIMIATAVVSLITEITQQVYAHKMAKLEHESSQMAKEYEENIKRLDEIDKGLGLALEGYDLTKMFNYNVSSGLATEPMMSFETSEEFLASMNTDPKSMAMLQDVATFEYINMSREIFNNNQINLVEYFNHSQAV